MCRITLSSYMFESKVHIDNWKKNLLSRNIFSRCLHNMVNLGPLMAEIGPVICGSPANFNVFCIFVSLLQRRH